jgi:WhiB family redox-sensing transcriptional regulator
MQWPDAIAGAGSAAEDESVRTMAEAVRTVEQDTAVGTIAALFGAVDVPGGLDLPCTEDPELFFAEAPADVEAAKALCQGCRARVSCLEGAIERREPWGVWGGELLLRGTVVPRKRPRGRPRKDQTAASQKDEGALSKAKGQAA